VFYQKYKQFSSPLSVMGAFEFALSFIGTAHYHFSTTFPSCMMRYGKNLVSWSQSNAGKKNQSKSTTAFINTHFRNSVS